MGTGDLPLVYLGWGKRDFSSSPVAAHRDRGLSHYLVLKGDLCFHAAGEVHHIVSPAACVFDRDCLFGIQPGRSKTTEILVWVWRDSDARPALRTPTGGVRRLALRASSVPALADLHARCRDEVARADHATADALAALRALLEIELLRAGPAPAAQDRLRWQLAASWIQANLSIHTPVPAICDYLRMSPSTLRRFFLDRAGVSPGAYFRAAKLREARRLISEEGWQVKTAAYHLGYRHATDLSRALHAAPRRRGA